MIFNKNFVLLIILSRTLNFKRLLWKKKKMSTWIFDFCKSPKEQFTKDLILHFEALIPNILMLIFSQMLLKVRKCFEKWHHERYRPHLIHYQKSILRCPIIEVTYAKEKSQYYYYSIVIRNILKETTTVSFKNFKLVIFYIFKSFELSAKQICFRLEFFSGKKPFYDRSNSGLFLCPAN